VQTWADSWDFCPTPAALGPLGVVATRQTERLTVRSRPALDCRRIRSSCDPRKRPFGASCSITRTRATSLGSVRSCRLIRREPNSSVPGDGHNRCGAVTYRGRSVTKAAPAYEAEATDPVLGGRPFVRLDLGLPDRRPDLRARRLRPSPCVAPDHALPDCQRGAQSGPSPPRGRRSHDAGREWDYHVEPRHGSAQVGAVRSGRGSGRCLAAEQSHRGASHVSGRSAAGAQRASDQSSGNRRLRTEFSGIELRRGFRCLTDPHHGTDRLSSLW
jgi:hypothetical protein